MADLETFRRETRAWLAANCPAEMREPVRDESDYCWGGRNPAFKTDAQKSWMEWMGARGWTVPEWPKAYGGGGLHPRASGRAASGERVGMYVGRSVGDG